MSPLIVGLTLAAVLVLGAGRLRPWRRLGPWVPIAAVVGAVALLLAPAVWAAETVNNGSGGLPAGGPGAQGGNGFGRPAGVFGSRNAFGEAPGGAAQGQFPGGGAPGGFPGGGTPGQPPTGSDGGGNNSAGVDTQLLRYLVKNQGYHHLPGSRH